jgi:hypothetical protein
MSKIKSLFTPAELTKSLIIAGISLIGINVNAQSQNWWRVNGNTPSGSDFLGTTNNTSLIFKTNNITRFSIDGAGNLSFPSLTGTGIRFLTTDATGKMTATPSNSLLSVLSNNGVGVFQKVGNDYLIPTGNVGIGIAPSPGFKLDVIGDARISNNLYVGGGIVVTDQVQASTQVKGWDIKVDHDLNVTGSASFTGSATFKSGVVAGLGLDLGTGIGFKSYTSGNPSVGNVIMIGPAGPASPAPPSNYTGDDPAPCLVSGAASWLSAPNTGFVTSAQSGANKSYLALSVNPTTGNGHIDATGSINGTSGAELVLNGSCNNNTRINWTTGKVLLGTTNVRSFLEIGDPVNGSAGGFTEGLKINSKLATGMVINCLAPYPANYDALIIQRSGTAPTNLLRVSNEGQTLINSSNANALSVNNKFIVDSDGKTVINSSNTDALTINNLTTNNTVFDVKSNGYTEIKVYSPNTMPKPYGAPTNERVFTVRDMSANKDLFAITSKGLIYAREVEINLTTTFPDYVFAKDYKLKSLSEVDAYIKANQHLPNFEKGSYYEKNGINVTDLLLKQQQTIEELMLYNIELEKRLKALEEK